METILSIPAFVCLGFALLFAYNLHKEGDDFEEALRKAEWNDDPNYDPLQEIKDRIDDKIPPL